MLGGKGGEAIEEKRRDPRAEDEADGREDGPVVLRAPGERAAPPEHVRRRAERRGRRRGGRW